MEITKEILESILDAYIYEIVFVDREHIVRYMNKTAKQRYGDRVQIGNSLFNCHNQNSKIKIEEFLRRADAGEEEMFELLNGKTGEREFFVPVRDIDGKVIGYFERHEMPWNQDEPEVPVFEYWKHRQ
ncbi:MAG: PAS domain-containing protein [Beduini sp.]|uniref:PAS domain-containing protein n=1 Tax=Beduini sp. TaxID=1922300 RepID=UPI0011C7D6D5